MRLDRVPPDPDDDPDSWAERHAMLETMGEIARRVFLILEKAWQLIGRKLVDFKVEFGYDTEGNLLLADVIDNDSWRIVEDGRHIDKQAYRDGAELNEVTRNYRRVMELTSHFQLPRQRLIIWTGSPKDPGQELEAMFKPYMGDDLGVTQVCISMHKEPVKGVTTLDGIMQEMPDQIMIALIGRSNGAGPTLSANCSIPVITVPVGWKSFPQDVWSSLRTPSLTPVMTVLEPKNALLAALQILAMRNPRLYAQLRMEQEPRLTNVVRLD